MRSKGYRSGTRYRYSKDFRKHGVPKSSTYTKVYKIGQYVDIIADPACQKGMPFKYYHGLTGKIYNINPRSVSIMIHRRHGPRYVEKRITVRVEHIRASNCNKDFVERCIRNDKLRKEALARGEKLGSIKRIPPGPREAVLLSTKDNEPIEIKNEAHIEIY